jgi:hypothetical protein
MQVSDMTTQQIKDYLTTPESKRLTFKKELKKSAIKYVHKTTQGRK